MGAQFVSLDGLDTRGVRAEVNVQTGAGVISAIEPGAKGKSAAVTIVVEGFQFPVKGNITIDDPIYEKAVEAKQSGEIISYRIESQRKSKVDRTIPIKDLRTDAAAARENTVAIVAALGNVFSKESVTNPDEDPAPGGRVRADSPQSSPRQTPAPSLNANDSVTQIKNAVNAGIHSDIVKMLAAAALAQGADSADVINALIGGSNVSKTDRPSLTARSYAHEEPSWKPYNSDGRLNYGSATVAAGVGVETFIREHLSNNGVINHINFLDEETEKIVKDYLIAVLSISDDVQASVHGEGFTPDRSVNSHNRARGIVYDTIRNYLSASTPTVDEEWVKKVTELSARRFSLAASTAEEEDSEQKVPVVVPVEKTIPVEDEFPSIFFPRHLDFSQDEKMATTETINEFKELVANTKIDDLKTVGSLMRVTFGQGKRANNVPDELLGDFVLHYLTADDGEEDYSTFLKACEWAAKH